MTRKNPTSIASAAPDGVLAYDIPGLCRVIPVGRSFVYAEVKAGRLRALKAGRRTLFACRDVEAWLELLRREAASAGPGDGR